MKERDLKKERDAALLSENCLQDCREWGVGRQAPTDLDQNRRRLNQHAKRKSNDRQQGKKSNQEPSVEDHWRGFKWD